MRGQGATEYLVLLAVILIIALVSIALLGYFPGLAGDARQAESDSYWRGEATPFAIMENSYDTAGTKLNVVLQNTGDETLILTNFNVSTDAYCTPGGWGPGPDTDLSFDAGEKKPASCVTAAALCASGGTYDVNVSLTYNSADISGQKEFGSKNLIGKCP